MAVVAPQDLFSEALSKRLPELGALSFSELRKKALDRFALRGLPTTKDEEWRFTSVRAIAESDFDLSPSSGEATLPPILQSAKQRLIFVDGIFSSNLSHCDIEGATFGALNLVRDEHTQRIRQLLEQDIEDASAFVDLNTALFSDGYCLHIPKGVILQEPLYVGFIVTQAAKPKWCNLRSFVFVDEMAQGSLVEVHFGEGNGLINTVNHGEIADSANFSHAKIQLGSEETFHIAWQDWNVARASVAKTTAVTIGGGLVRNDSNAKLSGEGAECTINGLYVGRNSQHIDNHTRLEHAAPHCPSHELFKGVLDGKSSAVFNGKIFVHQVAQKTDSKQSNMNLILSDDAIVNTKPQLEIFADDVRCTHGATIGRLDDEALFYLRSRGIGEAESRRLLIYAFASDVIERIGIPEITDELERMLFERFA